MSITESLTLVEAEKFLETGANLVGMCERVLETGDGEKLEVPSYTHPTLFDQAGVDIGSGAFHSYRNFGVAAAFTTMDHDSETGFYARGNVKKQGQEKRCAEHNALAAIEKTKFTRIVGGLVMGTGDKELIHAVTGVATPTLHPCPDFCQPQLRENWRIPHDMPLVTVTDNGLIFQVFTLDNLLDLYDENESFALMNNNISNEGLDFSTAYIRFKRLVELSNTWRNKPSPADMVISALLAKKHEIEY